MTRDISAELARLTLREDEQAAELVRQNGIIRGETRELPPLGSRDF